MKRLVAESMEERLNEGIDDHGFINADLYTTIEKAGIKDPNKFYHHVWDGYTWQKKEDLITEIADLVEGMPLEKQKEWWLSQVDTYDQEEETEEKDYDVSPLEFVMTYLQEVGATMPEEITDEYFKNHYEGNSMNPPEKEYNRVNDIIHDAVSKFMDEHGIKPDDL